MLKSLFILSVGLFLFAHETSGQVCHVQGFPENIVTLPPQNETLPGNVIFATLQLVDVDTTTTVAHPHNSYVQALRYPNGAYELVTTATFKDFISAERTGTIMRQANLYCNDGTTVVRVTFNIPVTDFNNQPPTFDQDEYTASVDIPANPEDDTTLIETKMTVSDADYQPQNAQVVVTSDHSDFTPTTTELWNTSYPLTYEYEVNIVVNNSVAAGVYLVNLTASDGVNEGSATVEITVTKEEPQEPTTQEPEEPIETTSEPDEPATTEEPTFGPVDHQVCGGAAQFHELRVQGSEGPAANMTTGTPYQISAEYNTVSTSQHIRLSLSTEFEGSQVTLVDLVVPDSSYGPGQRVTARFEVTVPASLSGEALQMELRLSNHNTILESCVTFNANIL